MKAYKRVAFLLVAVALGIVIYKIFALKIPFIPEHRPVSYRIEAKVTFHADGGRAKISLQIPKRHSGFEILNENYVSEGFGISTQSLDENRKVTWTRSKASGPFTFYYEATVRPLLSTRGQSTEAPRELVVHEMKPDEQVAARSLISKAGQNGKELASIVRFLSKSLHDQLLSETKVLVHSTEPTAASIERALRWTLELVEFPVRRIRGLDLGKVKRNAPLVSWIEVFDGQTWKEFNVERSEWGVPSSYFAWWRGGAPLLKVEGVQKQEVTISITPFDENSVSEKISKSARKGWTFLHTLPVEIQAVLRIILLIPVGGLVVVLLRNVIGIETFGTFMPVLIALAFRETRLLWGLILFVFVMACGLLARRYFEHLKLLLVPRLASTLTIVVMIIVLVSFGAYSLGLDKGPTVALFPMVIITMTIERMSIQWEEVGSRRAFQQAVFTLIAASLVFLVITSSFLEYLLFTFPECLLIVLACNILLGRYTGYRLLELSRFSSLGNWGNM